jgi:hypothetical protein
MLRHSCLPGLCGPSAIAMVCSLWLWMLPVLLLAADPGPDTLRPWPDYRTIMWVGDTAYRQPEKVPLFYQRLREMGINTAMVHGDGDLRPLLDNRFPYYVENLVNRGLCLKFHSKVTDWDKFVTEWARNGRPDDALVRDYCLDDPEWRNWAKKQVQDLVRKNRDHSPLMYNLRDELSTTISANPFDYDFSPLALTGFREWLKTQYRDLAALNAQWETQFKSWEEVKPFTTDQVKNRMASGDALPRGKPDWQALQGLGFQLAQARQSPTRWNFSPWADFRSYMDLSLARALDGLRQAARELDARTPVGVEGTQMAHAFGGYDLWRLSQVMDWVEPYDIGCAREIFGSFMPNQPLLTTVFESQTNPARRRLWHLLLEGDRGCLIWWSEDCIDWKQPDYPLTPKAKALAPVLQELGSPLAQLFLRAKRERDPIFIHYSQPSIQADWLIESTADGSTWLRRFSSFEAHHNRQAKVRNAWLKAFQDLGFSPQFVSSEQIERGALRLTGNAALVLPSSFAFSDLEAVEMLALLRRTSVPGAVRCLFADGTPGAFDQHGKLRSRNPLEPLEPFATNALTCIAWAAGAAPRARTEDLARFAVQRRQGEAASGLTSWMRETLGSWRPEVTLPIQTRARVHRYQLGAHRLLAFERNIDYQMSEDLKQAGGNEALEKPVEVKATLASPGHVYDLRTGKYLGQTDTLQFHLDPWQPSLFAVTRSRLAEAGIVETLLGN